MTTKPIMLKDDADLNLKTNMDGSYTTELQRELRERIAAYCEYDSKYNSFSELPTADRELINHVFGQMLENTHLRGGGGVKEYIKYTSKEKNNTLSLATKTEELCTKLNELPEDTQRKLAAQFNKVLGADIVQNPDSQPEFDSKKLAEAIYSHPEYNDRDRKIFFFLKDIEQQMGAEYPRELKGEKIRDQLTDDHARSDSITYFRRVIDEVASKKDAKYSDVQNFDDIIKCFSSLVDDFAGLSLQEKNGEELSVEQVHDWQKGNIQITDAVQSWVEKVKGTGQSEGWRPFA